MTDAERLDWLEKHWDFTSKWDYRCGHVLKGHGLIEATGKTLREAIDALKSHHDLIRNQLC